MASSKITGETTTERLLTLDVNQTVNATGLASLDDQRLASSIEDEIFFYFVLHKLTVPTVFSIIILVGLLGNLLVIGVTLSRHKMWTTVNLLLLNLAVTDIIFVVVCVPFMAYHYAADNWLVGDSVCKLSQFVLYVTVYVTVYTLVAIAVIRLYT